MYILLSILDLYYGDSNVILSSASVSTHFLQRREVPLLCVCWNFEKYRLFSQ